MRKLAPQITLSGYTLIEILVGITIIGLLFSLGYSNYRDYARRQALLGVARRLKADLRLAQGQALAGKKPDDLACNSPEVLNGYDFYTESNISYKIRANCSGGAPVEIKEVKISSLNVSLSSTHDSFTFKVLGQGTNLDSDAVITLTQAGTDDTLDVTVNTNGEIE